jgi:hypothetical protein
MAEGRGGRPVELRGQYGRRWAQLPCFHRFGMFARRKDRGLYRGKKRPRRPQGSWAHSEGAVYPLLVGRSDGPRAA